MEDYIKQSEPEFDQFASDYRQIHTENINKVSGADSEYFSEYKIKEIKDDGKQVSFKLEFSKGGK